MINEKSSWQKRSFGGETSGYLPSRRILPLLLLVVCLLLSQVRAGTAAVASDFQTDEFYSQISDQGWRDSGGNLGYIHADDAYALGFTGAGVRVGIIDSIFMTTGEFAGKSDGTFYNGYNPAPGTYHGIHVGGILAAAKNNIEMHGVAYNANVYTFASSNPLGAGFNFFSGSAYNDIFIINNSWGMDYDAGYLYDIQKNIAPVTHPYYNQNDYDAFVSDIRLYMGEIAPSVAALLQTRDVLLVFAAGNEGALAPEIWGAGLPLAINGAQLTRFSNGRTKLCLERQPKQMEQWNLRQSGRQCSDLCWYR